MINWDDLYEISTHNDINEIHKREEEMDFEAATNIQFTSGTTGYPKGATLSHHNVLNNSRQLGAIMEYDSSTKICLPVPLYHTFGMGMGSLSALNYGSAAVYPCEGFNAREALKAIDSEDCHSVYGVPSMFNAMLKERIENPNSYTLEHLDRGVIAGSICPEELMKKINSELGIEFISIAYGMTETSPVSFQTRKTDTFEKKVTTVGSIHPQVEAKIVDEQGKCLFRGEEGEILTRGYCVMIKYWNDPQKTDELIDNRGWCHTGDLGVIDQEGYLEIVGRVKDMIIRGGENIFPKEIENHLLTHPNIHDAQVIGVNDEKMGEEIMACIQLYDTDKIVDHTEIYEF